MKDMQTREELVNICHKVYDKNYVSAYDGNLSCRLSEEKFLITPSGKCKGEIKIDDLLVIDNNGKMIEGNGKVSTEVKLHLIIYKRRKDVNAVIHCHPIYSTAFATAGEGFTRPVFPEVVLALGKVPLCKYATPSTDELPDSILPYVDFSWAFLLENHGAVTIGKTIKGAYYRMEK
ncbi:MAG: class II aldolase/adducin family protein, partial [Ignavibacteriales bacterium]|nr:class II aldolase/adducin family protein [Ignavibacteriales bacterium]